MSWIELAVPLHRNVGAIRRGANVRPTCLRGVDPESTVAPVGRPTRCRPADAPPNFAVHAEGPIRKERGPLSTLARQRRPRTGRRLMLGHHFDRLVRSGVVKDYAE